MPRFFYMACLALAMWAWPAGAMAQEAPGDPATRYETGVVREVTASDAQSRRVDVELSSGPEAGHHVTIAQHLTGQAGFDLIVAPGDAVVLVALPSSQPDNPGPEWQIADYQRARPLTWLAIGVLGLLLLVGGWRGLQTTLILALTGGGIVGVLLPLALRGWNPLPVAVALAALIALVTTGLTSGLGRKSAAAVLGASGAVAVAATLSAFAAGMLHLSGVASDEAVSAHAMTGGSIHFAGLLTAGMLIGALGIVLDLALSISAAVVELAATHPGLDRGTLRQAGLQVGRDLLSTSSNTLLLAYLGGFLPVLLALGAAGLGFERLVHQESLAAEATAYLVGLTGLLVAVPLTAAIAAALQPRARL